MKIYQKWLSLNMYHCGKCYHLDLITIIENDMFWKSCRRRLLLLSVSTEVIEVPISAFECVFVCITRDLFPGMKIASTQIVCELNENCVP